MIQPDEIRRKALNLYPAFVDSCLGGSGDFRFPRAIPFNRDLGESQADAGEAVRQLRLHSKAVVGHGYCIEWVEVRSRKHGTNLFPQTIRFDSATDLLKYIGKEQEFDVLISAATDIKIRFKELEPWIRSNRAKLLAAIPDLPGLLEVLQYLRDHPRPGCFARELPLSVGSKFVEEHQSILRPWLDAVLLPHTIRADETHFERRYGLRYAEPEVMIRFLDAELQARVGSPWTVCAVPLHTLEKQPLPAQRILIVENKVPLLTVPAIPKTVVIGGLGNGVADLRYLEWLRDREIWYWGDMDVPGFGILSRFRVAFEKVRSLLMDFETLQAWRTRICGTGKNVHDPAPTHLTAEELAAFHVCESENLIIEQERFPQAFVYQVFAQQVR